MEKARMSRAVPHVGGHLMATHFGGNATVQSLQIFSSHFTREGLVWSSVCYVGKLTFVWLRYAAYSITSWYL